MKKNFKIVELKNGAILLYKKRKWVKATGVKIGFRSGGLRDEIDGTAHFLEHCFFLKTSKKSKEQICDELSRTCAVCAGTSLFYTCVDFERSNRLLEKSLEFSAELLLDNDINQESMDKEKGVIEEELRLKIEDFKRNLRFYDSIIIDKYSFDYPKVLGTYENILNMRAENLQKYKDKNYVTGNFIASVCSKRPLWYIKKLINKYFINNMKQEIVNNEKLENGCFNPSKMQVVKVDGKDNVECKITLKLKSGYLTEKVDYNSEIIRATLASHKGILGSKLREKGLIYSFSINQALMSTTGLFYFIFKTSKEKLMEIIKVIGEVLHDVCELGISKEKIDVYKENAIYHEDEAYNSRYNVDIASDMFYNYIDCLQNRNVYKFNFLLKQIAKCNTETTKMEAREIFNFNNDLYITIMGNIIEEEVPNFDVVREILLGQNKY